MAAVVTNVLVQSDGDDLNVSWEVSGDASSVDVAVGPSPDEIDHAHVVTVADGQMSLRIAGAGRRRSYVSVAPHGGGGAVVAGERRVVFSGVTNFRDLGGYATRDGKRTRWGQVFRSDALHRLTPDEYAAFEDLGLRAVYDLRGDAERERYPNPFPSFHLILLSRASAAGVRAPVEPKAARTRRDGEQVLRDTYGRLLAEAAPRFGEMFARLAEPGGLPAVFHCTGGKDRTGTSAAILLDLLGVPRADVLDDYELTAKYRLREHQTDSYDSLLAMGMGEDAALGVLSAPRWAMAEALEELDSDYGGSEAYLTGPAGVSPAVVEQLRTLLTG